MTVLARWTFKTAAMLNLASEYRQIILPGHLHESYRTKRVPANSAVDLAIGAFHQPPGWVQGHLLCSQ